MALSRLVSWGWLAHEGDDERHHDGEEHNGCPQSLRRGKPWRVTEAPIDPDPPVARSRASRWVIGGHSIALHTRLLVIPTCGVDIEDTSGHFASPTQPIGVISLMPMSVTLYLGVCSGNSLLIVKPSKSDARQGRPGIASMT
jgi:hypothetical protein